MIGTQLQQSFDLFESSGAEGTKFFLNLEIEAGIVESGGDVMVFLLGLQILWGFQEVG